MQRPPRLPVLLLAASSLVATVIAFFAFPAETAVAIAWRSAPYLQLGLLALFGYFLWRIVPWARVRDLGQWRAHRWGLLLILLCAAFLASREPADFKVTNDELVLAASAMDLHFDRDPAVLWRGYEVMGVFEEMGSYLDKRPTLYPLLVSLTHDLTGFRVSNSFHLNRALTLILAALTYAFAYRLHGFAAGALALTLLAGVPLLAQNASGGGFEILNLVMILVAMHCALTSLGRPSYHTQGALVMSLLLLAHTRYESGLFAAAGATVVLVGWKRQRSITVHWPLVVAPLGLVTIPLHMRVFELHRAASWQLPAGVETPFSLDFLPANLGHAAHYLFLFGQRTYSSPLIATLGALAAGFVALFAVRARRQRAPLPDPLKVLLVFSAVVAVIFVLHLCYHWGQLTKYESGRLALPTLLAATLLAVWALVELAPDRRALGAAAAVGLAHIYLFAMPASATRLATLRHHPVRRMNWEWQRYQKHSGGRSLIVSNDSLFFLIHRVSAIPPWLADLRAPQVSYHLRSRTFTDVLVFQLLRVDPATGIERLLDDHELSDAYQLEPLAELSFRPWVVCRMSRVVAVDPSRAGPRPVPRDPQPRDPGLDMEPYEVDEINAFIKQLP